MCAACRLPLDEMLCPRCEGEVIDKRHCPSQISCGDCGRIFALGYESIQIARWPDPLHEGIDWVQQHRMWWEDGTVFDYLDKITAPSGV